MATTYTPTASLTPNLNITEVVAAALNSFNVVLQSGTPLMPLLDHTFANGSASGQINKVYWTSLTLAVGTPQTLTLSSLTDPAGQSIAFTTVLMVIIRVRPVAAGDHITLGNAAVHPVQLWFGAAANTMDIRDLMIQINQTDGWTVTSGSADQLLFTNASGADTLTVDVVIVGR